MSTSKNAKIQIETGQTVNDFAVMTDAGDHLVHTISGGTVWSGKSGFTPDVRPNGIVSGRNVLSAGTTNDTVRIAAFTAYAKGVLKSVSAATDTFSRHTNDGNYSIHSITMASDGSIAVVSGSQGSAISEVRNAAGGPPYIPVNSVEVGQIRISSATAAAPTSDEIYQVVGSHTERYDYPVWSEDNIGDGQAAATAAQKNAYIKFASALGLDHTGGVAKKIFIKYYAPILSEQSRALNFRPSENTHNVTSQEYYRGTIGSVSSSIGQGGFTALLNDGLTDAIVAEKDQVLTVKFFADENKTAYSLTQGTIGLARTFPVDNQNQAEVTISAETITAEFAS
jgi:hypothetical protein